MKKKILILGMVMTLVSIMIAPGAAIAADSTDVTGTVTNEYTFSAPSAVDLGSMSPSETPHKANSAGGSLKGTNVNGYTVKGVDATVGANKGFMVSGSNVLGNRLQISDADAAYVSANETKTFLNTIGPTDTTFSLYVSQLVTYTDPAASGYSITITFTVTEK